MHTHVKDVDLQKRAVESARQEHTTEYSGAERLSRSDQMNQRGCHHGRSSRTCNRATDCLTWRKREICTTHTHMQQSGRAPREPE